MRWIASFVIIVTLGAAALAEDWPRWRGPQGDAIVRDANLLEAWPADIKPLWTAEVGIGFAAPVAQDGKVYLFSTIDKRDTLIGYDAATGAELWRQSSAGSWTGQYPGARASPTIDADRIYTYGGDGELTARALSDGQAIWSINILKHLKARNLTWGSASTPLVAGEFVYVQGGVGGPVAVCLNKADGTLKWTSEAAGVASYAGPILIDVEGTPQLIVFAGKQVVAMDPGTGKTIWSHPWETDHDVHAATPIYRDGHLFITSGYRHGCMMLKVSRDSAEKLWENKSIVGRFVSPILDGDHLYGSDESGLLRCLSWPDGKVLWQATGRDKRLGIGGAYVRAGENLIAMSDNGTVFLYKATPQGLERISATKPIEGTKEAWSAPVVHNGRLYLKGGNQFVCLDISRK